MKPRICLVILCLIAFASCPAQGKLMTEDDLGRAFVEALASKKLKKMERLLPDMKDIRATLALDVFTPEEREKELERLEERGNKDLEKTRRNLKGAFYHWIAELDKQDLDVSKAIFVGTQPDGPDRPNAFVPSHDVLVFFTCEGKRFIANIDDCLKSANGWRITGKYMIYPDKRESE